jgi:putative hydrolase of the HAD superfamily
MTDPTDRQTPADALILDFGSVVTLTMFETHRLSEQELGLPRGSLTWLGPFDPAQDALWASMQRDEITERDYWLARTRETGRMLGQDWSKMSDFIRRARGRDPQAIIRPEIPALLAACKAGGKKLAILSNELDLFFGRDLRESLTFLRDFDAIVDATYTKVLKPNPDAYRACLAELGIVAEQAVFIDDQMRNVTGGLAENLRAIHLDVRFPQRAFNAALAELGLEKRFDVVDHAARLKMGQHDAAK